MACGNNSLFCNIISLSESLVCMKTARLLTLDTLKTRVYTQHKHGQCEFRGSVCTIIGTELLNKAWDFHLKGNSNVLKFHFMHNKSSYKIKFF